MKLQSDMEHMRGLVGSGMSDTTTLQEGLEGVAGGGDEALLWPKAGPSSVSLLPAVLQTAVMPWMYWARLPWSCSRGRGAEGFREAGL